MGEKDDLGLAGNYIKSSILFGGFSIWSMLMST